MNVEYIENSQSEGFSQVELDKFRRQMRVDAPDFEYDPDYVKFIERYNGGKPFRASFEVAKDEWFTIDRFLNFSDMHNCPESDLIFHVHQNWNMIEDRLKMGMFPFAALSGGDFLVFEYEPSGQPKIALWYHEKSVEGNPYTKTIANNFVDFVNSLVVST